MKNKCVLPIVLAVCLLSGACQGESLPPLPPLSRVDSKLLDPEGKFTLFVSNQSFAISSVDIEVSIDGEVVVHDHFDVGNQHKWKQYTLALPPGEHKLKVVSRRGEAELTRTFQVNDRHWAIVDYWYYPKSHYEPTPRKFTFVVRDEPFKFD